MSRARQGRGWIQEHLDDEFVQLANQHGYRSRAVYKLIEIDKKDRLFSKGLTVVELGAAPGSWTQYAHEKLGHNGALFALDLLEITPIPDVTFIQGDFTEDATLEKLLTVLNGRPVDLVISDMAPNITGIASVDQAKTAYLGELALDFCSQVLKPGGHCLIKTFQGADFQAFRRTMGQQFAKLHTRKPKASRARSQELYLLGKEFLTTPN